MPNPAFILGVLFFMSGLVSCRTNESDNATTMLPVEDTVIIDMTDKVALDEDTSLTAANTRIGADLKEVNSTFTFKGERINPKIIERFNPWLSDGLPLNISIDIAAAWHTDEFYIEEDSANKKSNCVGQKSETGESMGYFCYSYIGKLDNGIHVVQTSESGGGTGIFMGLLFFKFSHGEGRYRDGTTYSQLLMTLISSETLCDRCSAGYDFDKNKLIVKIQPRPTCEDCKPERREIVF